MTSDERKALKDGKDVGDIYHNTIDTIGDKVPAEKKVFVACEDAMRELINAVRIVIKDMNATDIFITVDHGFLYTYSPPLRKVRRSERQLSAETSMSLVAGMQLPI